jgi:hypothetical protein
MRGYRGGNVQVGRSKAAATRERKPEFTGVATPGPSVLIKAGEREKELRLALERSVKNRRPQKLTKQRARKLAKEARRQEKGKG